MRPLTIELEDEQYEALAVIAQQHGLSGPEKVIREQVDRLLTGTPAAEISPELKAHVAASIAENRRVLERLAR